MQESPIHKDKLRGILSHGILAWFPSLFGNLFRIPLIGLQLWLKILASQISPGLTSPRDVVMYDNMKFPTSEMMGNDRNVSTLRMRSPCRGMVVWDFHQVGMTGYGRNVQTRCWSLTFSNILFRECRDSRNVGFYGNQDSHAL